MPNLQMKTVRPAELGALPEVPWGGGISQCQDCDPCAGPRVLCSPLLLPDPGAHRWRGTNEQLSGAQEGVWGSVSPLAWLRGTMLGQVGEFSRLLGDSLDGCSPGSGQLIPKGRHFLSIEIGGGGERSNRKKAKRGLC